MRMWSSATTGAGHARLVPHDHSALEAGGCTTAVPHHQVTAQPSLVESRMKDVRAYGRPCLKRLCKAREALENDAALCCEVASMMHHLCEYRGVSQHARLRTSA